MKDDKMKYKVFSIILILFLFGFISIILEIGPRLFFQGSGLTEIPTPSKIDPYKANPYIINFRPNIYSHIPLAKYTQSRADYAVDYTINSFGFRAPEYNLKSDPSKKRIVFVGDSLVEGHGSEIPDTIPAKLEQELGTKFEVLSCGMQGASPIYYAFNLERYLQFKPDYLIIGLYDNDFYEDRFREANYDNAPYLENPNFLVKNSYYPWLFKSRFVQMLYSLYYSKKKQKSELFQIMKKNQKEFTMFSEDKEQRELILSGSYKFTAKYREKVWNMSVPYLEYIIRETKARNIPVYFVSLSFQSSDPNFKKDMAELAAKYLEFETKWASERSLPFFAVNEYAKEYFRKNPNGKLHIVDDGHPTKEAYASFAKEIAEWIRPQLK
ncbi:MAG TPA: GDSL-type esterase/lipase family protein [Leptospiraceae bacterium]|nr:GDSL-type esterase/lipase family protein [Leptospiraceae bacterium]HMW04049.1 GDSL-type esterase/lipase family protein [Leptospiraceae bacterium]HMX30939.1 GDSL-type esterase/lipase family protein [Leptospiraceae bacterium]HMY30043.1 GDSL-type esterase/lipase family protein [Leptospiraceae bacterium]HMZ62770.1 GDSL-type esterase/lipase family protein [Leptospiraceae bacterium]